VPTYTPKAGEVTREWVVIDATDVVLGRLASHAAAILRGKHKPTFANHIDTGDFVIVVNAEKVALTGQKPQKKMTSPPSHQRTTPLNQSLQVQTSSYFN